MNANHELERRLADFYATEAPQRAPDRVLESVLATTDTTKQRRAVFRLPWRFPIMNSYAKMAIAAVAVIAIGAVGLAVLRPGTSPGVGGQPPPALPVASPEAPRALVCRAPSVDRDVHVGASWVLDLVPDRLGDASRDRALDDEHPLLPSRQTATDVRPRRPVTSSWLPRSRWAGTSGEQWGTTSWRGSARTVSVSRRSNLSRSIDSDGKAVQCGRRGSHLGRRPRVSDPAVRLGR